MSSSLKETLLEVSGNAVGKDAMLKQNLIGNSDSNSHPSLRRSDEDILKRLQTKAEEQNKFSIHRRFIYRLAVALRSYGSSASRTEYLIERAAERLNIKLKIAVFPTLILLSFVDAEDETRNESHLITVDSEVDVDKLGRADELANNVGKADTQLLVAYWRLKTIAVSRSAFGDWWWRLLSSALAAATAAFLFFEGSVYDACFCFILGIVVGGFDQISKKSAPLSNLFEFAAAVVVSFLARVASIYLVQLKLCYSNVVLSALVQLLPGMSLTLGVSDLVAKAQVTGTSRIMYGLFIALQLGFGLSIGDSLVWWVQQGSDTCEASSISFWWNILWFLGYALSSNIFLSARLKQWPGMTFTAGVGYMVYTLVGLKIGSTASTVLAAFLVGITGVSYSYFTGDLPLIYTLSGILLLMPGGIGVKGVEELFQNDVLSGMSFVFNMMVVGLSITIGLLMAKIIFPAGLLGNTRNCSNDKSTLAADFEKEGNEPEEHMAI